MFVRPEKRETRTCTHAHDIIVRNHSGSGSHRPKDTANPLTPTAGINVRSTQIPLTHSAPLPYQNYAPRDCLTLPALHQRFLWINYLELVWDNCCSSMYKGYARVLPEVHTGRGRTTSEAGPMFASFKPPRGDATFPTRGYSASASFSTLHSAFPRG